MGRAQVPAETAFPCPCGKATFTVFPGDFEGRSMAAWAWWSEGWMAKEMKLEWSEP